jgi:DUF3050 family protein
MVESPLGVSARLGQEELEQALAPLQERLIAHPVYGSLHDERTVRLFMRSHVFAVWDFQSLLTALQGLVTCVQVPWVPTSDPEARRLVNEIVLDEESDRVPGGGFLSRYELYLEAMRECGADTDPVRAFVESVRAGIPVDEALDSPGIPAGTRAFVGTTMSIAGSGQVHRIAAAFAYGREEVIPGMFHQLVDSLSATSPRSWGRLRYYFNRHIGLDSEQHGPQAKRLVGKLCGNDSTRWSEAVEAAQVSLEARIRLWDLVAASLA